MVYTVQTKMNSYTDFKKKMCLVEERCVGAHI